MQCCSLARAEGLDWACVDTCCIHKTSDADLSEAITTMFKYSSDATVCFACLSDLASESSDGSREWDLSICRWFYRGWTLQELLAPSNIVFYDQVFQRVRDKYSLVDEISRITSIPAAYLIESGRFQAACIAQRMSWASKRQTIRQEDMIYCLLGIFLYGEGRKAFI